MMCWSFTSLIVSARSIVDTHTYIRQLDDIRVAFASEPSHLTSPAPWARPFCILAIFAEPYIDNLAAEISKGKKQRALKGYLERYASRGYTTPKRLQDALTAE